MARKRTWLEWLNPLSRVQRWFTIFAVLWLIAATFLLYRAFTRDGVKLPATLAIYLLATVTCSLLAFVLFGLDKRCAVRDKPRVSERTLHILSVLGGWPGAHMARILFRHKTLKMSFRIVFLVIVAVHLAIISYCMLFGWWVDSVRALITSEAMATPQAIAMSHTQDLDPTSPLEPLSDMWHAGQSSLLSAAILE